MSKTVIDLLHLVRVLNERKFQNSNIPIFEYSTKKNFFDREHLKFGL